MNQTIKICTRCKEEKDISEFTFSTGTKHSWCRSCRRAQTKIWASKNPDKNRARHTRYYYNHQEQCIQHERDLRAKKKRTVLEYYSRGEPKCASCGEKDIVVLCIDHINGHGQEHRRQIGRIGGSDFYNWLRLNAFPEGFQVLCYNCNIRKCWGKREFY